MNRLILAAATASATLLSTPAAAQRYGDQPYQPQQPYQPYQQYDVYDQYANGGYGRHGLVIRPHAREFQQRIHAGVRRGLFDHQDAARMMGDLQSHLALEQSYAPLGITRSESKVLRERLRYFQWALRQAERTGSYQQPRNPYGY